MNYLLKVKLLRWPLVSVLVHLGCGNCQHIDGILQEVRGQVSVPFGHIQTVVSKQFANDVQVDSLHDQPGCESVSQIVPVKIFDLGFLEVLFPIRVLDSVLEPFSRIAAVKNVGIMEHPRKALQGLNDNLDHGYVSSFPRLREPLPLEVNVTRSEIKHFARSHSGQ